MDELFKEIAPLVAAETERASKQYGDKYASAHEVRFRSSYVKKIVEVVNE